MTPAAAASFVSAELSEFLYAPIGSENNGMTLSVLSALTRLNIDPWDEAAQLCELPKHAAATRLCSLIARLPAGSWTHADCQAIAEHLIEFLPHRSLSPQDARGSRGINLSAVPIIIAVALGLAALLIAASCEPSRADGMNEGQSPFQTWHEYPTFATLMAQWSSAPQWPQQLFSEQDRLESRTRPARGAPNDKQAGAKCGRPQRTMELASDAFGCFTPRLGAAG
jgi:hypothetical protein